MYVASALYLYLCSLVAYSIERVEFQLMFIHSLVQALAVRVAYYDVNRLSPSPIMTKKHTGQIKRVNFTLEVSCSSMFSTYQI